MVSERRLIDCDIHQEFGDPEEFLAFIEPGQRDWFRAQASFGLPGYTWSHPSAWFRQDLEHEPGQFPASRVEHVQREVLDRHGVEIGVLTGDDGVTVSLMGSSYRAAAFARAHNDWMRELWLEREPRLRGSILCPAQDPVAAAEEIRRCAEDDALRPGPARRRLGAPIRRPALHAALRGRGRQRAPGRNPLRRRGHGNRGDPRRCRQSDLLHRVAHARLGVLDHGAPRLPPLPRHASSAWRSSE